MKKCIIFGGAGFIGRNLVEKLLQFGHKLIVFDNFSHCNAFNLNQFRNCSNLEVINADIRNKKAVFEALQNVDVVYNLCSPQMGLCENNPSLCYEVNIMGLLNILEGMRLHCIKRIIYASSSSIYGKGYPIPIEESADFNGKEYYSLSKIVAEDILQFYNKKHEISYCIFRNAPVFGPWQCTKDGGSGIILKIIENICSGAPLVIYGDGTQRYDFIYVADIVSAYFDALEKGRGIFNLSTEKMTAINDIIFLVENITGQKANLQYRKVDDLIHEKSISYQKARKELNFIPQTDIENGIKQFVLWYQSLKKENSNV